jgi:hypothetical protein
LEVLPDTTLCKTCAKSREPAVTKVVLPPPLDPQPYIDAQIPYARQNTKSFVVKTKKTKKAVVPSDTKPKYTQIGGLTKADKRKQPTITHVPVEFRSQGNVHTYQYRIKTFRNTFKVNTTDIQSAAAAGYSFYIEAGILYLDRKGKKSNVRIGKYTKRKAKK